MNKNIKFFITMVIIIFCFSDIAVYASSNCYKMPGANNNFVIPEGYQTRCVYEYKSGNNTQKTTINQYIVYDFNSAYEKDFGIITKSQLYEQLNTPLFSLHSGADDRAEVKQNTTWDGLVLRDGKDGSGGAQTIILTKFEESIQECPSSFFWVDKGDNNVEIQFSASKNPTINRNTKDTYAIYELIIEHPILLAEEINKNTSYTALDLEDPIDMEIYNEEIKKCTDENTNEDKNPGYGGSSFPGPGTTEITSISKVCPYYFKLIDGDKCYEDEVKLVYTFETNNETKKTTLSVSSERLGIVNNNGIKLNNIQAAIDLYNANNNSVKDLNDFITKDSNGNWQCSTNIYVSNDYTVGHAIFGESLKNDYEVMYGIESFYKGSTTKKNICPAEEDDEINWADPSSVNCYGIIGKDLLDFFNKIFKWIRIIAPIAVIVLGSVDFAGAVLQDDKDAMKKATSKFIKRLIVAVALFFIPLILEFILNVFNQITGSYSDICDIGK